MDTDRMIIHDDNLNQGFFVMGARGVTRRKSMCKG